MTQIALAAPDTNDFEKVTQTTNVDINLRRRKNRLRKQVKTLKHSLVSQAEIVSGVASAICVIFGSHPYLGSWRGYWHTRVKSGWELDRNLQGIQLRLILMRDEWYRFRLKWSGFKRHRISRISSHTFNPRVIHTPLQTSDEFCLQ